MMTILSSFPAWWAQPSVGLWPKATEERRYVLAIDLTSLDRTPRHKSTWLNQISMQWKRKCILNKNILKSCAGLHGELHRETKEVTAKRAALGECITLSENREGFCSVSFI